MHTTMQPQNFFQDSADDAKSGERIETLLENAAVRIERIASRGRASEDGFWYDQTTDEWVMLVRGGAVLEFESAPAVELRQGDWLLVPRHVRHRVARTSGDALWLAVHVS